MQSVPISIDVVKAEQLTVAGVGDTNELGAVIPGLSFQTSLNGMQPHLRGVGTTAFNPGEENSIATYLDGVYIAGTEITYHWTLTGTNTGPGGTGRFVRVSGFERWRFGPDGLIVESKGHFDTADYQRQLSADAKSP